jgi:hypothetical protein
MICQVMTGEARLFEVSSYCYVRTGFVRLGQVMCGYGRLGQVRSGQVRLCHVISC